ncbi:MAG: DUF4234 domain-containing protein [Acidimicrobiales bacterium]
MTAWGQGGASAIQDSCSRRRERRGGKEQVHVRLRTPAPQDTARPIGRQQRIGIQVLLSVVTLGLYGINWACMSHQDIRQHSNDGVGGVVGGLLYFFAFPVTAFLLPIEIQRMYERDGQRSPVRAATAFWYLAFGIPWYVKCQKALNGYWASKGAPAA